jgi:antitoxin component YwqK of YwqJK toxin-antitoxin module
MIEELKNYNPNSEVMFNDPIKNELHELVIMGYDQDELDYQNNKTENTIVEIEILRK